MNEDLAGVEREIVGRRGEGIRTLFDAQVSAAEAHLNMARGLAIGDTAPDFSLEATSGETISLRESLRRGPVILKFYRGSWCNFCNMALKIWQGFMPAISARGGTLIAISPEKPEKAREFRNTAGLDYELLSDAGNAVGDAYGLKFELPAIVQEKLADLGTDVGQWNDNGKWEVPVTATFVVGTDQQIALADAGPDYRQRLEPQVAISAL